MTASCCRPTTDAIAKPKPVVRVGGVILAAGLSSRMGSFKPLLDFNGMPAIERQIRLFQSCGLAPVVVVVGHRADDLTPLIRSLGAVAVFNPNFQNGMFSSIQAGIGAVDGHCDGCLILPVDIPLVRPDTIAALTAQFGRQPAPVTYPVCHGRRGHPPLIAATLFPAILEGAADGGLAALLARHRDHALSVAVEDPGILRDMDTPGDYHALQALDCALRTARPIDQTTTPKGQVLATTESVCPACLRRLRAERVLVGDDIYLRKTCPDHGVFQTIVWRGWASYRGWAAQRAKPVVPSAPQVPVTRGCPFDCGLCAEHRQDSCCVLVEVTHRCNLSCPVCFADAGRPDDDDSSLEVLGSLLTQLRSTGRPVNIQLSGGEPTLRHDLPDIVALVRRLGFPFVQINTNGLRLAQDPAYARRLKEAGLDCVFLQFDGLDDGIYRAIRGADLAERKRKAIDVCAELGLGVVLVPVLVPKINLDSVGDIIRFAASRSPQVRAVHFQPISYFGRYPGTPSAADRVTLPEVLAAIEAQAALPASNFHPASAENPYCSFSGEVIVTADGTLVPATPAKSSGCCGPKPLPAASCQDDAEKARRFVAGRWAGPAMSPPDPPGTRTASLDAFLADQRRTLVISAMAFQDAWTLDLERLRQCHIHIASQDHRLIPLCAANLTAMDGQTLYRGDLL
jgi:hypothetical protein